MFLLSEVSLSSSKRRGSTLKVSRAFTWKSRPESGRDCLICAEFGEYVTSGTTPPALSSCRFQLGTTKPVRAGFWPWLEPFSVRKSSQPLKFFTPRSLREACGEHQGPLPSEEGAPSKVFRAFTWKSRLESGRDCLMCAEFGEHVTSGTSSPLYPHADPTLEQTSQSGPDFGLGLSHFLCDSLHNH